MDIIENQYLSVDGLLSYKTRSTYSKLEKLIRHIADSLEYLNNKQNGNIIFSLRENTGAEDDKIIDLEFLVPVEKAFESNEFYVFKPKLRIENALKVRHVGAYSDLYRTKNAMQAYILENGFSPITDFYYSVICNDTVGMVDIYVGINGNIV